MLTMAFQAAFLIGVSMLASSYGLSDISSLLQELDSDTRELTRVMDMESKYDDDTRRGAEEEENNFNTDTPTGPGAEEEERRRDQIREDREQRKKARRTDEPVDVGKFFEVFESLTADTEFTVCPDNTGHEHLTNDETERVKREAREALEAHVGKYENDKMHWFRTLDYCPTGTKVSNRALERDDESAGAGTDVWVGVGNKHGGIKGKADANAEAGLGNGNYGIDVCASAGVKGQVGKVGFGVSVGVGLSAGIKTDDEGNTKVNFLVGSVTFGPKKGGFSLLGASVCYGGSAEDMHGAGAGARAYAGENKASASADTKNGGSTHTSTGPSKVTCKSGKGWEMSLLTNSMKGWDKGRRRGYNIEDGRDVRRGGDVIYQMDAKVNNIESGRSWEECCSDCAHYLENNDMMEKGGWWCEKDLFNTGIWLKRV